MASRRAMSPKPLAPTLRTVVKPASSVTCAEWAPYMAARMSDTPSEA
jgi:hypothetical protein